MTVLKTIARSVLHHAGGIHLYRSLNRNSLRILMFHRFETDGAALRTLEFRCRHLRRFYHPISLGDVARAWRDGEPLPPNALAVTVDDGYRDFFDIAYPVFAQFQIPVTVYVVTDFLDGKLWLWPDRLRFALEYATANSFTMPLPTGREIEIHLETQGGRERALAALTTLAKSMPDADRRRSLEEWFVVLGTCIPGEPPAAYAPLTWDSVRHMAANGIEFGAHTRTHPILSRVETEAALRGEIEGSKKRIEEELGRPVLHFCYPNGRAEDIGERAIACVRRAGFETAVVTAEGLNRPDADHFRLKRIPADPTYPEPFFQEYVAGVRAR